jgi:tRNA modification GTPase
LSDVPCDLYLWPNARSYTQQPSAELHLPGSPPILQAALATVCRHGARVAAPGEFTLRAFLAGRLDLTQAEAVLGVIDASSQRELDVALTQLAGGLAGPLNSLRNQLLDLLAHLEAGLDFVEEDIEFITAQQLNAELEVIGSTIERVLLQLSQRDAVNDAFRVVLTGAPNAGKSSLLNALAGEDAAMVSSVAGTTRDYVAREIVIDGLRCQVIDTAGLAGSVFAPDAAAETHARDLVGSAHLVMQCFDAANLEAWRKPLAEPPPQARRLRVLTKWDLLGPDVPYHPVPGAVAVSSRTLWHLDDLRQQIGVELRQLQGESGQALANTSARCRDSLQAAHEAVLRARELVQLQGGEELVAAELRLALEELGQVVGAVYTDDVLDRIFSRFCIGK